MGNGDLNWLVNFIWGIADDVLRDLYVRGKYRDVILPMTVLRRLDVVIEPTKQRVLNMKAKLDQKGITRQDCHYEQRLVKYFITPPILRFVIFEIVQVDSSCALI